MCFDELAVFVNYRVTSGLDKLGNYRWFVELLKTLGNVGKGIAAEKSS